MIPTIAIVGVGEVGSTAAYALVLNNVCSRILLVDKRFSYRDGQVNDLSQSAFKEERETRVEAATEREAAQADIVIITAAAKRWIGESTSQYLHRSTSTVKKTIESMRPFKSDSVLLIVTNPVDVLTSIAQPLSGLPATQVIGVGTFIDTIRLRTMLATWFGVAASSVEAMVLGEHGGAQFVPWSLVEIGGVPLDDLMPSKTLEKKSFEQECKRMGQHIVEEKGAITFSIATVISTICTSILKDRRHVYPVSHVQEKLGCSLSMPAVLGRSGVMRTLPISLDSKERDQLHSSAMQDNLETKQKS